MKQLLVGSGVFFLFVIYSLGIRHESGREIKVPAVASNQSSSQSVQNSSPNNTSTTTSYKDGVYTGSIQDAFYGNVQVAVTINGGKISDVKFLQYPNSHSTSVMINNQAMPILRQEAIMAQSANVQIVSGATFTAQAFQASLKDALSQA